jgi:SPW repeat-containing protein
MQKQHWQDWVTLLLGIWICVSPWTTDSGAGGAAISSYYIVGVAVTLFAIVALVTFRPWEEWVNLVLGAWLLVSPWLLGFRAVTGLMWNALLIGALVVACAGWVLSEEQGGKPVAK